MQTLSERELRGYPGASVELLTDGELHTVRVNDGTGGMTFGPTQSRAIARDWYFHPFVYGYNYKSRKVEVEDDGA